MICWCKEVYEYECVECEKKRLYNSLAQPDRFLITLFLKNMGNKATMNRKNDFEARHKRDWTDFAPDVLIEANANQNQTSAKTQNDTLR
jgi:hypothetical protein